MLEPDSRSLLSELLRPPPGYSLAHAVGTTFTLQLESALSVPLAFARTRTSEHDRIGVLAALHEAADRVDIFAQAGSIAMPKLNDLVALLEPMVHPIGMRRGLFHPKVWFLEFASSEERRYRFISSSRNLTSDTTWDAVVAIDGEPAALSDEAAVAKNAAMVELLRWMPRAAVQPLPLSRQRRIDALAQAWRTVAWDRPPEAQELDVHVLGIGQPEIILEPSRQSLIVSPFVSSDGLQSLRARPGGRTRLVARQEQLDRLDPAVLVDGLTTHVLDEAASLVDESTAAEPSPSLGVLTGLHAKLVVHDGPNRSRLLIGSANATSAAWASNVEVMVEIVGSTAKIGVDATFGALLPMLEDYATDGGAQAPEDEEAEWRLEEALRRVANAKLVVRVRVRVRVRDEDEYSIELQREDDAAATEHSQIAPSIRWHLLTRPDIGGADLPSRTAPYRSGPMQLREITPFVVVTAEDAQGRRKQSLLVARLENDIPERRDAIIASQLTSPEAFARFLQLLLQPGSALESADGHAIGSWSMLGATIAEDGSGFLELLVRAVSADQSGLDELDRVLRQLSQDERARAVPAGFDRVWANVVEARRLVKEANGD